MTNLTTSPTRPPTFASRVRAAFDTAAGTMATLVRAEQAARTAVLDWTRHPGDDIERRATWQPVMALVRESWTARSVAERAAAQRLERRLAR